MDTHPVLVTQPYRPLNPLHLLLVSSAFPLFLGALFADIAYARSYEIQWTNFASWLIVGGLVFAGVALLFAIIDLCRAERRARGIALYAAVLLVTWVVGFFNALMHARDAWASMPTGLVLSVIVAVPTSKLRFADASCSAIATLLARVVCSVFWAPRTSK